MLFMNAYEIEAAYHQFHGDPVLGPATRTLLYLAAMANRCSDGWAYWPKPCRAAKRLQELIQLAQKQVRVDGTHGILAEDVRRSYRPIKSFLTRHPGLDTVEIVEPA